MNKIVLALIVIGCGASSLDAQILRKGADLLDDGLSITGGTGRFAIVDDYISDQRYEGTLPFFAVGWLHSRDSSAYRLGFEYRNSQDVANHNVSASITLASLNLDFFYYTGDFAFLGRKIFTFVGPSTEMYLYYRQQNIASGGAAVEDVYSMALFFSGGINSTFVLPLSRRFAAEWSAELNLLAFGGRIPNMEESSGTFVKFVTSFSGVRGNTRIFLRYDLMNNVSIKVGYRFELCQSSSWDYMIAASDNLLLTLTYRM